MADRMEERDLFDLVKALYRTLQKVYHPDRSSMRGDRTAVNTARSVELNLAFEKLNLERDSESFRRYQRLYAARGKRGQRSKLKALKAELNDIRKRQSLLSDGFMGYLMKGLASPKQNGFEPAGILPTPTNLRLGLNDVAINQNVRSSAWHMGSNYKEIIFDALGGMLYRPVGRSKPFPVNYIYLLGTIDLTAIDLVPLLDRVPPREGFFKYPALDSRYGIDGVKVEIMNTLSLDRFKLHCLPLLSPDLKERSYLFSIHRPLFEQDARISLEGSIVKIAGL